MITVSKAIRLAKEIGGKDGLNCIAELNEIPVAEPEECEKPARLPSLVGVPILVKDNIDVKGFHTTAGSLALADNMALNDALIKSKLTKFRFVPLAEYVYDEHTKKEYAIKKISEGTAFPELIEAWLKHGVLTEQEVKAIR